MIIEKSVLSSLRFELGLKSAYPNEKKPLQGKKDLTQAGFEPASSDQASSTLSVRIPNHS